MKLALYLAAFLGAQGVVATAMPGGSFLRTPANTPQDLVRALNDKTTVACYHQATHLSRSQLIAEFKSLHISTVPDDLVARIYFVRPNRSSVYSGLRRLHKGTPVWSNHQGKMVLVKACGNVMAVLPAHATALHNVPYYISTPAERESGNNSPFFLEGLRSAAPPATFDLIGSSEAATPVAGETSFFEQPPGALFTSTDMLPMEQNLVSVIPPKGFPTNGGFNGDWLLAGLPLLGILGGSGSHHPQGAPPPPHPVPEAGTLVAYGVGAALMAVSVWRKRGLR